MRRASGWALLCWFLCWFAGGLLAGCAAPWLSRAESAYDEGRYLEVAEDLARHEKEIDGMPDSQRARYGLYRGLALMKLGDHGGARRWLGYARDVQDKDDGALDDTQESRLEGGWTELAKKGIVAGHHEMPKR